MDQLGKEIVRITDDAAFTSLSNVELNLHADCSQIELGSKLVKGMEIRNVVIRNKTQFPKTIYIRGALTRVDNLIVYGCQVVLDQFHNSTVTNLAVLNAIGDGLTLLDVTNVQIDATIAGCSGFGLVVNGSSLRMVRINAMPFENNRLGQVLVQQTASWKHAKVFITGTLNSSKEDGPPITIAAGYEKHVVASGDENYPIVIRDARVKT